MKVTKCRICGHETLTPILEYGQVALADGFLEALHDLENEPRYALNLCFCENCQHLQIDEMVEPDLLFSDYVYETGVSPSVLEYASEFSSEILARSQNNAKPKVFEVASNDGTVLAEFQKAGCEILGMDPAKNIVEMANARGIRSIANFFNEENARDAAAKYGEWDILLARNVMAHVADLHGFAKGIQVLLKHSGFAVIECPHLLTMYEELQYDQVFHEHIGFHSLDSVRKLFNLFDMEVFDVKQVWIHGGSIRLFLQHRNGPFEINDRVTQLQSLEEEKGLLSIESWLRFAEQIREHKHALLTEITELKKAGKRVAVYGASGKGQSLLQYCGLDHTMIEYVVDKSTMKQGKFTPGTHIPIYAPQHLYRDRPDVILLCAWNFASEIIRQEGAFSDSGGKFLHPLPLPHYL